MLKQTATGAGIIAAIALTMRGLYNFLFATPGDVGMPVLVFTAGAVITACWLVTMKADGGRKRRTSSKRRAPAKRTATRRPARAH